MYCKNCYYMFEEKTKRCPNCYSKNIKEIEPNDPVFLIECNFFNGETLRTNLEELKIPYILRQKMGTAYNMGLGLGGGPWGERYRFFVPYCELERCRELADLVVVPEDEGDDPQYETEF